MFKFRDNIIPVLLLIMFLTSCFMILKSVVLELDEIGSSPNKGITFIWNDDEESIPVDGSLIKLEFTQGDTIYIGPAEY